MADYPIYTYAAADFTFTSAFSHPTFPTSRSAAIGDLFQGQISGSGSTTANFGYSGASGVSTMTITDTDGSFGDANTGSATNQYAQDPYNTGATGNIEVESRYTYTVTATDTLGVTSTINLYPIFTLGQDPWFIGDIPTTDYIWASDTELTAGMTFTMTGNNLDNDGSVPFTDFPVAVVPCFARGVMIDTSEGEIAVEDLQIGDFVRTADNGFQAIEWIGSRKMAAFGKVAPILIKKGAMGNTRDLLVSPEHRVLVAGWQAEVVFGEPELLVAAKHLVNDHSVLQVEGGEVEYFHVLFNSHEIIFSEGIATESLHPGVESWDGLGEAARAEILSIFPELEKTKFEQFVEPARTILSGYESKVLSTLI